MPAMDIKPDATLDARPITTQELHQFLCEPSAYPDRTSAVSLKETHISWVFLTDSKAYKFKKPVRFPFLDYSTPELRLHACREELRLNRRLAPNVYLDIVPVTLTGDGKLQLGRDGQVVEYCVEMQRLPAERILDRLIAEGVATPAHIERLLDVLLPFYAAADRGPEIVRHATAEAIEANARQNLTLIDSSGHGLSRPMLNRVRASQLQFLRLSASLFADRIRSDYVCEGHGDLRPEHVCMIDPPAVFDCVEFSLPLRAADVISELAFLAMECDFLGAPELATAIVERYQARAGDLVPNGLVSFYKSYRACIRAKVDLLRAAQQSDDAASRARAHAQRYLQLASFYATEFYRPKLFVMVGAAGTGKSTVADALADALGLELLRSDAIRHELAGRREPDADIGQGIYSDSMTDRTYETLFARADTLLREAVSVVLDGTFCSPSQREQAIRLAHMHGAEVHFVYCRCPADIARRRIAQRIAQREGISDARPELHDLQQQELNSAPDWSSLPVIEVDTSGQDFALVTSNALGTLVHSHTMSGLQTDALLRIREPKR